MFSIKKVSEIKVVPETKPAEETTPTVETKAELEKQFDENAVTEQSTVRHSRFGTGTVRKIEDRKIYVEFVSGQRLF